MTEFGVDPDQLGKAAAPFDQLASEGEQIPTDMANQLANVHPWPDGKENDPTVSQFAQWYNQFNNNMQTVGGQFANLLKQMTQTIQSASQQSAQAGSASADLARGLETGGGSSGDGNS